MHETSLVKNLITTIENVLKDHNNILRVNRVFISVGKLSNALPDALSFAFEALTKDGIMKGAELIIESQPAIARCGNCGQEYQVDEFPIVCPVCKSTSFAIISGEEVYVQSIDCEESEK